MIDAANIDFRLAIDLPFTNSDAKNYRPPTWPPHREWPIILDEFGDTVSRWGDPIWRLDPWVGKRMTLNFGDGAIQGRVPRIDRKNADLLRIITGWWIYGPNGSRGARSLKSRFDQLRKVFVVCACEGVLGSDLTKFPRVIDVLSPIMAKNSFGTLIPLLHELYENRISLGFVLLDRNCIARLAATSPTYQISQTPYIPPRIWNYQVSRLRECLDDFLAHRAQIEECFRFCVQHFIKKGLFSENGFGQRNSPSSAQYKRIRNRFGEYSSFDGVADSFGLKDILNKWIYTTSKGLCFGSLTSYLTLVAKAGLAYILNFSLMRVEEAWNLKVDCLEIESDGKFGDIYLLRARTTKTIDDPDALWVTSPSVKYAVDAMRAIAFLREEINAEQPSTDVKSSVPYLIDFVYFPWFPKKLREKRGLRPMAGSYQKLLFNRARAFFEQEQMRITHEDLAVARLVTPTLSSEYMVGSHWHLAWHQLRRTGAVNMQASGLVSDASLQYQLKHVVRAMSLYYGQNHSRLKLEQNANTFYVRAMYETLGRQLQFLASRRFASPHGERRKAEIVRLIAASDLKKVQHLARKGTVGYRSVLLGICTSRTPCPYGGIDNIAHCGGGSLQSSPKPCADVLYDSEKLHEIEFLEDLINTRLSLVKEGSPIKASLEAPKRSLENYRDVVNKGKSD